jgi:hypothetical protein
MYRGYIDNKGFCENVVISEHLISILTDEDVFDSNRSISDKARSFLKIV